MTWGDPPPFIAKQLKKIISKKEAKAAGLKHYFTGWPCKNGHVDERWVVGGACKSCKEIDRKNHRKTEKFKQTDQNYYLNNKEKILAAGRLNRYNLTQFEYELLLSKQNNKCAICEINLNELSKRKIQVDHCHTTRKIRGILCLDCNLGLGRFYDDLNLLKSAINYLKEYDNGLEKSAKTSAVYTKKRQSS